MLLIQSYMKRIQKAQLNAVVEEEKPKDIKPVESLGANSRSQFKRVVYLFIVYLKL